MTRTKTRANANMPNNFVSVLDYGADPTGTEDSSIAIQAAVDALQGSSKTLYIPNGEYKLSRQGEFFLDFDSANKPYAIRITDTLSIVADGKFLYPINSLEHRTNAFVFDGVSDFSFEGGHFENTEPDGDQVKTLYLGAAVLASNCTTGRIFKVHALDTSGCALALASKNITISDCFYSKLGTVQSGSSFGIYGGRNNLIERCVTYGGTQDGDIGCYGTGNFNRISLCKAHSHKVTDTTETPVSTSLQGIFVDAAQHNATVESCYVQGYFYGIDVKSNISNCFVLGNTCYKNKVSITARRGELNTDSMDVTIQDNLIIPVLGNGNDWNGLGYKVIGIYIQDFASVLIQGNEFTTSFENSTNESWVSVLASCKSYNEAQRGILSINNNKFKYSQSIGGITSVNQQRAFINVKGYQNLSVQINGNSFSHASGNAGQIILDDLESAAVSGNTVANTSFAVNESVPFVVSTKVKSLAFNSNNVTNPQNLIDFTAPASTSSRLSQLMVNGNTMSSTANPLTMIETKGVLGCSIVGNIRFRPDIGAPFGDGKLLVATDSDANSKFALIGNVLRQTNVGASNYYSIDGVDGATGNNIKVLDAV